MVIGFIGVNGRCSEDYQLIEFALEKGKKLIKTLICVFGPLGFRLSLSVQ